MQALASVNLNVTAASLAGASDARLLAIAASAVRDDAQHHCPTYWDADECGPNDVAVCPLAPIVRELARRLEAAKVLARSVAEYHVETFNDLTLSDDGVEVWQHNFSERLFASENDAIDEVFRLCMLDEDTMRAQCERETRAVRAADLRRERKERRTRATTSE